MNPELLYINSFLHFSKKKEFEISGNKVELCINLLDKRFLTTFNLDDLQAGFPGCRLENLDDNYIEVFSYYPIVYQRMFYNLLNLELIVPVQDFVDIIEL